MRNTIHGRLIPKELIDIPAGVPHSHPSVTLKVSPVRTDFEWMGRGKTHSSLSPISLLKDSFLKFLLTKDHNFYPIKIFNMQISLEEKKQNC